jgi:ABC-type polysaccharide/polyol phosphate transport system ATPase subunit
MGSLAIELDRVSKAYRLYPTPRHRALELLTFGTRKYHTDFWALTDVSLRLAAGATLGLVGNNGSGKSTLLQLISGIMGPTTGSRRCWNWERASIPSSPAARTSSCTAS